MMIMHHAIKGPIVCRVIREYDGPCRDEDATMLVELTEDQWLKTSDPLLRVLHRKGDVVPILRRYIIKREIQKRGEGSGEA